MNMYQQIDKLKKIRDFLQKEAPRDSYGRPFYPFAAWIQRCDAEIAKAKRWQEATKVTLP